MPSFVNNNVSKLQSFGPKFGPQFGANIPQSVRQTINTVPPSGLSNEINDSKEEFPRIIHYNADQGGCALWRMEWPGDYLTYYKKATVMNMHQMVLEPYFYKPISAVRFQRQCRDNQVQLIEHMRKIADAKKEKGGKLKILWEVDDIVAPAEDIPFFNKNREPFQTPKILENLKRLTKSVDEFVVVSDYMRRHYEKYLETDKITVIPNYLPLNWLGNFYDYEKRMRSFDKNKNKPRIGYIGSASHYDVMNQNNQKDDFSHIIDFIAKTVDKYQWVFIGGHPLRLRNLVKEGKIEYHKWSPIIELQTDISKYDLNLTIAPLQEHVFNRAKSDIKLMESSAFGIPCICQDLEPYESALVKFKTAEELEQRIEDVIVDDEVYSRYVKASYELTKGRWIHEHLDEYLLLYLTDFGSEERKKNEWFVKNNPSQFSLQ